MKIKLMKSKKLKEMTDEEIKADVKEHIFFTFATLGVGFLGILVSIVQKDYDFTSGLLGCIIGISTLHLLLVTTDKFELRIRELLQEQKK